MNVSLPPELEKFIHDRVAAGLYSSASEVVREGLRLLVERRALREARIETLRAEVALGLDSLDAGRGVPFDDELLADVKRRGREILQQGD